MNQGDYDTGMWCNNRILTFILLFFLLRECRLCKLFSGQSIRKINSDDNEDDDYNDDDNDSDNDSIVNDNDDNGMYKY